MLESDPHPSTRGLHIAVDADTSVSALLRIPDGAWAGYVFAHGAGAGIERIRIRKEWPGSFR